MSADPQLLLPEKIREVWIQTSENGLLTIVFPKEAQQRPIHHRISTELEINGKPLSMSDFKTYMRLESALSLVTIAMLN